MKRIITFVLAMCLSGTTMGATIDIDSTGHYVPLNDPEYVDLENDHEIYPGYRRHISAIDKNGKSESHWCYGTNILESNLLVGDELVFGAGYCTILDEEGDAYWTWFEVGKSGTYSWKVMGGTGKYSGSSGSGIATGLNFHVDGTATFRIEGKIELVGN